MSYRNATKEVKVYLEWIDNELEAQGLDRGYIKVHWGGNGIFHKVIAGQQVLFTSATRRELADFMLGLRNGMRTIRWLKRDQEDERERARAEIRGLSASKRTQYPVVMQQGHRTGKRHDQRQ